MHIISVVVSSLDGYITKHDGSGAQGWASPEDQTHFFSSMATCDVSVMGGETYRAAREAILRNVPTAGSRRRVVWTRDPLRHVADAVPGKLEFTSESLSEIVTRLRDDGHRRCCVVGGGQVYGAAIAEGLIDELQLTIEPLVFGTGVRHTGVGIQIDARFSLAEVRNLNANTLLLRYLKAAD